ncbi:MAG: hypothetical protein GF390_01310, partial [Candidatus Pacebacteria bacterium]|nr:hypothetical protein [Candidatus Paceibacterota bacterium]
MLTRKLKKIPLLLTALLIFLTPSNLFIKFLPTTAYVNGLLIDYLIPKLYLTDLVILGILGLISYLLVKQSGRPKLPSLSPVLVVAITVLILRQALVPNPLASAWYLLKLLEMAWLFMLLKAQPQLKTSLSVLTALLAALIFQASLAIYQFHTQSSLAGFWFLGEVNLQTFYNMPEASFFGQLSRLPFGTTSHPNVLAGMLVIYWLLAVKLSQCQLNFQRWLLLLMT